MKAFAPRFICLSVATLSLASLLLGGCAASEERVQEDFSAFVSERNSCEVPADCVVESYGCPLGCGVAFNKRYEDEVAAEAERLIKKYERGGRACQYSCPELGEAVCDTGTCSIDDADFEECDPQPLSLLDLRIPQVSVEGECPFEVYIESELDLGTPVETFQCEVEGDDCLCLLALSEAPLDDSHFIAARQGDAHLGRVSPFLYEDACSATTYGTFLATVEDFEDVAFLSRDVSRLKEAAFAAADRTGCADDRECLSMPIGAKACGGPTAHIIYSAETTDEETLSGLAQAATEAERSFNQDNEITSNCAYNEPPVLICQESVCVRSEEEVE